MRRVKIWTERMLRGETVRRLCSAARRRMLCDDGSASLEFLGAGLILLVPLVYLVVTLGVLQGASLAVEGAARHAARVYVQSADSATAQAAAERAVEFAFVDYGLDPASAQLSISCRPGGAHCLRAEALVTVRVRSTVPLPLVPDFLSDALPLEVPVEAESSQEVSRFAGSR